MSLLLAAVGGGLGSLVRHWLSRALPGPLHPGIVAANVLGCFALGVLLAAGVNASSMALLGAGFCGGLTTYSTFAVQSIGPRRRAEAYVCLTIGGCLTAAWLGLHLGLLLVG